MDDDIINVSYTNWRGETKVRRVRLGQVRFGTTDWHEEPTWLISAFDMDHPAQIWKEFDLSKCDFNRDYIADMPILQSLVRKFIAAEDAVEHEAERAEREGGGWSSAAVVRRCNALSDLRAAIAAKPEGDHR